MSKFNAIEISSLVSLHPKVETHKLFGLFERVQYQPTHSKIESYRNYYSASEASIFQQIADAPHPEQELAHLDEMQTNPEGSYRVDLCLSHDCKFAAFQVFERRNDEFVPFSKLCFLEGELASKFENLLA